MLRLKSRGVKSGVERTYVVEMKQERISSVEKLGMDR